MVLVEFGVMMALCSIYLFIYFLFSNNYELFLKTKQYHSASRMSNHIRMYSLSLMSRSAQKEKPPTQFPFIKLKGTRNCSNFSVGNFFTFFPFFIIHLLNCF